MNQSDIRRLLTLWFDADISPADEERLFRAIRAGAPVPDDMVADARLFLSLHAASLAADVPDVAPPPSLEQSLRRQTARLAAASRRRRLSLRIACAAAVVALVATMAVRFLSPSPEPLKLADALPSPLPTVSAMPEAPAAPSPSVVLPAEPPKAVAVAAKPAPSPAPSPAPDRSREPQMIAAAMAAPSSSPSDADMRTLRDGLDNLDSGIRESFAEISASYRSSTRAAGAEFISTAGSFSNIRESVKSSVQDTKIIDL